MTLPESTIIPNPTLEEQTAFLEANKDAMHFVYTRFGEVSFPCIALHMVNKDTGMSQLPFRFVPITPSYKHLMYTIANAAAINSENEERKRANNAMQVW